MLRYFSDSYREAPSTPKNKSDNLLSVKCPSGATQVDVAQSARSGSAIGKRIPRSVASRVPTRWRVVLELLSFVIAVFLYEPALGTDLDFTVELSVIRRGWDGHKYYVHSRAGAIPPRAPGNPSDRPVVVMTTQKHLSGANDIFDGLHEFRTDDLGQSWQGPKPHASLDRRDMGTNIVAAPCDFTPKWHAASGKLLGTGKTFWYKNNNQYEGSPADAIYSVYDARLRRWSDWKRLEFPDDPKFHYACAGCTQRYDLPHGDVLLPIYFQPKPGDWDLRAAVALCTFDGRTLSYVKHGTEMELPDKPEHHDGLAEPSLTKFGDHYFLTIRSIVRGYVTTSDDGLTFAPIRAWRYDDGQELGNYQTQQHWVTHSAGLYLVYTRRGADNDHIFRHRAPLFIARVDPERLVVLRETEQVLVPQTGTRMGNFGVVKVSPQETWVITTEWMQQPPPGGFAKYGSDNRIFCAKIRWSRPNES